VALIAAEEAKAVLKVFIAPQWKAAVEAQVEMEATGQSAAMFRGFVARDC
jgi:hypothetical protein